MLGLMLPDLLALLLAAAGVWLVRRSVRAYLLAAVVVIAAAWLLSRWVPDLLLSGGDVNGFGAAGVETRWYPAGVLTMAVIIQLTAWRRIPRALGMVLGVVFGWLGWAWFSVQGAWIS